MCGLFLAFFRCTFSCVEWVCIKRKRSIQNRSNQTNEECIVTGLSGFRAECAIPFDDHRRVNTIDSIDLRRL